MLKRRMVKTCRSARLWHITVTFLLIFLGLGLMQRPIFSTLYYLYDTESFDSLMSTFRNMNIINHDSIIITRPPGYRCPDVTNGMMKGRWKSRPLSHEENREIDTFLETVRSNHGIPKSLQRPDGKCGTVTYENLYWFRALCNPKGPTPCCFESQCVAKSPDECKCPNCYDLRSPIHAEYSTWIPEDPRCEVKNFTASEACQLLHGMHVVMVGDSLMRQLYQANMLILTNNRETGAFKSNLPEEARNLCRGMYAFTEKECRSLVNDDARLCKDTVTLNVREFYKLGVAHKFHSLVKLLLHLNNTMLVVGVGYHDSFDYEGVYKDYILPVIQVLKEQKAVWPRIIWTTNHQFGLLKTPNRPDQDNYHIETFNRFMIQHLRQFDIPVFDTYNMTSGVMSIDGSHYGMGLNLMKAQMFLNFLQELKYQGKW